MTKFKYDENGNLIAIRDGKKVGQVITMGDVIEDRPTKEVSEDERQIHQLQERSPFR